MFGVEKNAKDDANHIRKHLKDSGMGDRQASRIANRHEQRQVRSGNRWISKNVGLN
jgi:hypothetical protein